jgi:CRP/FNR family cyclic AMP-dependent transcriptional regulator
MLPHGRVALVTVGDKAVRCRPIEEHAAMPTEREAFVANPRHPESLRALVLRGDIRRYRKGTILIQEGDVGDTLFVMLQGRVKVYCVDTNDKEITFGVFGAAEFFGEMALDGGPRSASVITLEPSVCAVVHRPVLRDFIAERPEFSFELLSKVIQRLRMATRDARNLAFIDVYGRITRLLNDMASLQADGRRLVAERITHQDIASRVGCSREMVSRILKDLARGQYLAVEDRQIVLLAKLPQRW